MRIRYERTRCFGLIAFVFVAAVSFLLTKCRVWDFGFRLGLGFGVEAFCSVAPCSWLSGSLLCDKAMHVIVALLSEDT